MKPTRVDPGRHQREVIPQPSSANRTSTSCSLNALTLISTVPDWSSGNACMTAFRRAAWSAPSHRVRDSAHRQIRLAFDVEDRLLSQACAQAHYNIICSVTPPWIDAQGKASLELVRAEPPPTIRDRTGSSAERATFRDDAVELHHVGLGRTRARFSSLLHSDCLSQGRRALVAPALSLSLLPDASERARRLPCAQSRCGWAERVPFFLLLWPYYLRS